MNKKIGYSVWLWSNEKKFQRISLINNILFYLGWSFKIKCHLTIHGYVKKNISFKNLKKIKSFTVKLGNINCNNDFFKYLTIAVANNKKLTLINQLCKKYQSKEYKVNPHISLCYGDFFLARFIGKFFFNFLKLKNSKIYINKISLVKFDEKKYKWKLLKTFNLRFK